MRILLITITYPPEIGGASHLIHELAQNLKGRGHQIAVLTTYPSYNLKTIPPKYLKGLWMEENLDGIQVRRIRVPSLPRENKIARGIQHFVFGIWLSFITAIMPRVDSILVFSPPLPLPWLVNWVGKIRRIPVFVNIQDLFPRQAVELGMLTNPLLIRFFEAMEKQLYRSCAGVTVHSPGNRDHVIQHGGQEERVHIVYNWVNTDHIHPGKRENDFSDQNGLKDHFVISYAGTMGWAQDMTTIIQSAARLKDYSKILFLLVGDGVEKEKAQALGKELELMNVMWLPMQPWSVYPEVLAASDVSLINLHPELRTPVVPSKLLSIMAASRPVVASLPAESDARQIIDEAGCGIYVEAGDNEALSKAILKLVMDQDLGIEMGKRGRSYVEQHFSRKVCIDRMEAILINLSGGK